MKPPRRTSLPRWHGRGLLLSSPFLFFRLCSLLALLLRSFSLEPTHQLLHPFVVRLVLRFLSLLNHRRKEAIVFPQLSHCPLLLLSILRTQFLGSSSFRVWVPRAEVRGRPCFEFGNESRNRNRLVRLEKERPTALSCEP